MTQKPFQKDYWERSELKSRRGADHPAVRGFVEPKVEFIRRHVPMTPETTLLDVGCGNGFFTHQWDKVCKTIGVDYSETLVAKAICRDVRVMDARNLEFDDDTFDVVFESNLLHHLEDERIVLREMGRVSRKHVVISEPNPGNPLMWLFGRLVPEEARTLEMRKDRLVGLLQQIGLTPRVASTQGLVAPNKLPGVLASPLSALNFEFPWGLYNVIIATKEDTPRPS